MSYIGKEPQTGAYSMLDALTASATASYSLTLDSVAFVPESANHLLVSLNGSIQKAGSSYTVSGSTLTFSSTLASSDSIDFVLALGNVLDIGTPSDATVTNAKTNFVSTSSAAGLQIKGDGTTDGTLQLNCSQNSHGIKLKSPAHSASQSYTLTFPTTAPSANTFLKTDGSGNLSFASAGGLALIDNGNGTSASSLSIQSKFTSTYTNYYLVINLQPVGNGNDVRVRLLKGSAQESDSEYRYVLREFNRSSSGTSQNDTSGWGTDHFRLNGAGISSSNEFGLTAVMYIMNPLTQSSTNTPNDCMIMADTMYYSDNSKINRAVISVDYQTSEDFDGIHFYFSSDNIQKYNYSLFGISGS